METVVSSGCFNSNNSIIYFNKSSINEYKWDNPSGQELLLYRKFSEIIYDVENTLTNNINNDLSLSQVLDIIRDASATIRKYISDYIGHLFTEKEKLEYQLTKESINANNLSKKEVNFIHDERKKLTQKIEILINCEYVWNIAEIFWIETQPSNSSENNNNNSILITLKFLDVMNKFRSPNTNNINNQNIEMNSNNYWELLYKNAMYGNLKYIIDEINNFQCDHFTKKLLIDLCNNCPIYNCLYNDTGDTIIPSKDDIILWKNDINKVKQNILSSANENNILPLLEIFLGDINRINLICDKCNLNWLDWIYSYLMYKTPFIDHKNELAKLVTMSTNMRIKNQTEKGSIEWMFGCIMTNEYLSILDYSNKIFPLWFSTHLCYFLRRLNTHLIIEWPRIKQIENEYNGNGNNNNNDAYNYYISLHPKMTIIEWIFEYYVEYLLNLNNNLWIWLKNYIYFFKRRGLSILSNIFESINISSDSEAYLILQNINAFNLNSEIYNNICIRMAYKSYINTMSYGRITYWFCKCKCKNNQNEIFNKYLYHIIFNYLNRPPKYINIFHDICDNATQIQIENNKLLNLINKLRDMYLCRYDLQKLDIKYNNENINKTNENINSQITPLTKSRGKLIDELLKSTNKNNKNLQNIADSFPIMSNSPIHVQSNINTQIYNSPFPKSVLKNKNKTMEERVSASTDFLLNNLITPPRPTPNRTKNSHITSIHKHTPIKKNKQINIMNIDDQSKDDKNYETQCCDIIISYVKYLMDIITKEIYDLSHFIPIIIFSLPIFIHKYAPNSITVNNILIITHKWYKIKFIKNNKKTKIKNFDKHELDLIQNILAHLQSKVLATTYSKKNYAQIWKLQQDNNIQEEDNNNNNGDDDEKDKDDDDDDDMIEID